MAITGWGNFRPLPRIRQDGPMADHPHTIDRWDDATGESLIEQIAAVSDYLVALETYRAAVKRWPKDKITLRNRARVIEQRLAAVAAPLVVQTFPSSANSEQDVG